MTPPATVYFHVETQQTARDVGGWHPERMGLAVGAILSGNRCHFFEEGSVDRLIGMLLNARQVIGYNLNGFDLRVLSAYANPLRIRALDMLGDIEARRGVRPSFGSVCRATLGRPYEGNALKMVEAWKRRDVAVIRERGRATLEAFKAVHTHGCEHGHVFHFSRDGRMRQKTRIDWT